VGIVLLLLVIAACLAFCLPIIVSCICNRIMKRRRKQEANELHKYLLETNQKELDYVVNENGESDMFSGFDLTQFIHNEVKFESLKDLTEIGNGGSGTIIFKANMGVDKVVLKLYKVSKRDFEKFKHELKILDSLRHPNIVICIGACMIKPRIGIVLEYCERGSLASLITKEVLKSQLKMKLLIDIARGMAFLHSKNIIHRDLKCDNILIDSYFVAKITGMLLIS